MITVLFISFLVLLFVSIPVSFSLLIASSIVIYFSDTSLTEVSQEMFVAINSFPLLAVPFFILTGELMNRSGITKRLIDFTTEVVGWIRGGLSHVVVMTSLIFAGLSGVALADAIAIGTAMIPEMEKKGFHRGFSSGLIANASLMGAIIPPSVVMIVYGSSVNLSIGGLFMAGIIPGILIAAGLMLMGYIISRIRKYPKQKNFSLRSLIVSFFKSFFVLLVPVIIIGGIRFGIMTPTEAGAIAVGYTLFLGLVVYRTLSWKDMVKAFSETTIATASVMLIFAAARPFGWILSTHNIPQNVAHSLVEYSGGSMFITVTLIVIVMLVAGMFLDPGANVIIFAPIFAPVAVSLGMDPFQFALIFIITLMIGNITPPVGIVLYAVAGVAKIPFERVLIGSMPFLGVMVAVLLLVSFIPVLTIWIPRLMGLG